MLRQCAAQYLKLCLFAIIAFIAAPLNLYAQWIDELPRSVRDSILWSADYEEGDLSDWTYPTNKDSGGGVLNTVEQDVRAEASLEQAHSGKYSAMASISKAIRARSGPRAVRLMRWSDKPWDRGGKVFPEEAYYSTWMYLPETYNPNKYRPWDPGDGGWWNVFQFKAHDDQDVSQSAWTLSIRHDDGTKQMYFYLYSSINTPSSHLPENPRPLPVKRWFHLEAYYKMSLEKEGAIRIVQDGVPILDVKNVRTILSSKHKQVVWGIGNYTDHIAGGPVEGDATVYFDDSVISTRPLSTYAGNPTTSK